MSIEELYWLYPRHVEKRAALRAIEKSIQRLRGGESGALMNISDAETFLKVKVGVFAKSPAAKRGTLTKQPATWFNKSCYLDDPNEWELLTPEEEGRYLSRKLGLGVSEKPLEQIDEEQMQKMQTEIKLQNQRMLANKIARLSRTTTMP